MFIRNITNRIHQIHKRKAFVPILLIVSSLAAALLMASIATFRLDSLARDKSVSFTIDTDESPVALLGSGINLDSVASANLIADASFEPHVFKSALTVIGGDQQNIFVSNSEAKPGIYGSQFFRGAGARIYSYQDGKMTLKKAATVTNYVPNQIGPFYASPIIGDFPWDAAVRDSAQKDDTVILVGERGMVVSGADTQAPVIEYPGVRSDFVAACSNNELFFICTADGLVFSSADAVEWESWKTPGNFPIHAIAASEHMVVAASDHGILLIGYDGVMYERNLETDERVTDVLYDGSQFVAITAGGSMVASTNGLYWAPLSLYPQRAYDDIEYADSLYAVTYNQTEIAITGDLVEAFQVQNTFSEGIKGVAILSRSQILLVDGTGTIYESSDQGLSWSRSPAQPSVPVTGIYSVRSEKIICTDSFLDVYVALLVTHIDIDSPLNAGQFQAGDLCYLAVEHPNMPSELIDPAAAGASRAWEFYGSGEAYGSIDHGAPSDGIGVLKMVLTENAKNGVENQNDKGYVAISQSLGSDAVRRSLTPGEFYVFSIWLRKDTIGSQTLKVWISGSFDPIGMEFRNIGTEWRKYTFKFSFPPGITQSQAAGARINLAVDQPGVLYLDKAYLGQVSEMEREIPESYQRLLRRIQPSFIRLNFLDIGTGNVMPNRWALNETLENALNLTLEAQGSATPWLVIDSTASEAELRNIMEYLCGSISTPYGKMRLQNGSALPWINRFDRIAIEFTDQGGILGSDSMKALHINYYISTIESTPYYPEAKNKLMFIDGLDYKGGIMLSRADYTASDLSCSLADQKIKSIENAVSEYVSAVPRVPDRPGRISSHIARSVLFANTTIKPATADYTALMMEGLGMDAAAGLLTLTSAMDPDALTPLFAAAQIAGQTAGDEWLPVKLTTEQGNVIHVKGYAFRKDGQLSLVIASFEVVPVSVSITIRESLKGAAVAKYDASGSLVADGTLTEADRRMTVLPGQVIVVRIA